MKSLKFHILTTVSVMHLPDPDYYYKSKDYSAASQNLQGHFTQGKNINDEQRERKLYGNVSVVRQTADMSFRLPPK